jgi:multiple sugar transport system substrate-binding protein
MKRLLRLFAAAAVLAAPLSPVPARAEGKTEDRPLIVWAMGEEGKKIAAMARRFEELHPGVKVETQAIPWEAAHAKILTAVVGGIPPDVSQMGTTWMAEFAAMDALEPVDDRAKGSATASPEAFFPGSLSTCLVNGVLYGVPWYVDTRVLFYRKDLLAQVGFPNAPQTWDELKKAAQRLSALPLPGAKRRYGLSLGTRSWTEFLPFVWQNQADPLRPSSPAFMESVQFYLSFFREGLTPTKEAADTDQFQSFKTGYLPMFISGPWMVELVHKELPDLEGKWGVSLLPGKKTRTSFVGGCNLVVFKESKRKDLAWSFVEFMSDPVNQAEWFKITTDLPSSKKAWAQDVFKDKPMIQTFGAQMYETSSPPVIAEWEQIANAIDNTMEKILLQAPSQDVLIKERLLALESTIQQLRIRQTPRPDAWRSFFLFMLLFLLIGILAWMMFPNNRLKAGGGPSMPRLTRESFREFINKDLLGYMFILPALTLLVIFLFIPIVVTFFMSLTDLNIFNLTRWGDIRFIGWDNYERTFLDPIFWKSLWNTLYFAGFGVPLTIAASLLAAVALNQKFIRGRAAFRISLFAPVVTTLVAVAVVWKWIYNPEYGLFNWFLQSIGLKSLYWLADPKTSLLSLILMSVWKNFGYNMVIFLAGLQTIPESHYEAARIDGANSWECFRFITLPGLAPTMVFVVILTTIGYLQFFAEPYVMTKGGPLDSTMSIVFYMFNHGFRFFNLGYASAISYVLFGLIFCFTFLQLRLKKSGFEVN